MSKGPLTATSAQTGDDPADNALSPADLDRLRGLLVPFDLHFFPSVASTNDAAADLAAGGGLVSPAVVTAGRQTAGRGQRGRSWFTGRHSLAASFVVPVEPARPIHHLPILAGLAVREALAGLVGEIGLKVKWPNDIQLEGRKLAGLLCERRNGADIIGIGINIRHAEGEPPAELRESVTALAEVSSAPDRWEVLAALGRSLAESLLGSSAGSAWSAAVASWARHDAMGGRDIVVATPAGVVQGRADGIDAQGRLRLTGPDGVARLIISGSVRSNG